MKVHKLCVAIAFAVVMNISAPCGLFPWNEIFASDRTVDSPMPVFENTIETDHFVLKWTSKSRHHEDNITDPKIVKDTGDYLEIAWNKYMDLFGRQPYMAPGRDKIDVVFRDMDCYGVSDPPNGPIQFNSFAWVTRPGIRQPTSAHELFHKIQYAYGYKTKWKPHEPYLWFTEGTAAWSEVFVWGRVSRACKVDTIFRDTSLGLYQADDMAMPFWIFFVHGNHPNPNNQFMVKLFEKCEQLRDERLALREVISESYGPVDDFFKSFARNRRTGFWADACDNPYRCILGPDGKDVVEMVKDIQKKNRS